MVKHYEKQKLVEDEDHIYVIIIMVNVIIYIHYNHHHHYHHHKNYNIRHILYRHYHFYGDSHHHIYYYILSNTKIIRKVDYQYMNDYTYLLFTSSSTFDHLKCIEWRPRDYYHHYHSYQNNNLFLSQLSLSCNYNLSNHCHFF